MSTPFGDDDSLCELKIEVEVELSLVESSISEETTDLPASQWLVDPTDIERDEVGLRGLLGAVEALERRPRPGGRQGEEEGA